MNRIIKIMVLALLLGLVSMFQSCSSWLDIMPEAQVNDEKMFSTQQGFKDVLNGIYITASSEKLYANNLLFGFVDALAQYYEIPDEEHEFAKVAKYEYKDVEVSPKIDEMWLELYFCIANCNILLERLEEVGPTFFEDERVYYVMHGEALALRAFFHFDLLRLWAPSYKKDPNYMVINGEDFVCPFTAMGKSLMSMVLTVDYIDLDYGMIGAYYSAGVAGPAYGGGTGYLMLRFQNPVSPEILCEQKNEACAPFKPRLPEYDCCGGYGANTSLSIGVNIPGVTTEQARPCPSCTDAGKNITYGDGEPNKGGVVVQPIPQKPASK